MRDIWDGERKRKRIAHEQERRRQAVHFLSDDRENVFQRHLELNERPLKKIQGYYHEHLELKKVAMDFFPDYQRYLGGGGFSF